MSLSVLPHANQARRAVGDLRVEALSLSDPLSQMPRLERELQHDWFVWDAWTGGRRRVDLHPLVISRGAHREASLVAKRAVELVLRAGERAARDPAEEALYRLHPDVVRLARAAQQRGDQSAIVRVDLLLAADGRFVACEVNADCPGGYNETLALPRLSRIAGARASLVDPTTVAARLADALVARSGGPGSPRGLIALVYATAWAEDLQVCALIEKLVRDRGGRVVRIGPTAIKADGDVATLRGERVSVLYRFYPLEYMEGQRNVEALERATLASNLDAISSFSVIWAQSKLAMARAFASDREGAAFVFPETFYVREVPRATLERERSDWVIKRDLSRVGDHVYVGALTPSDEFSELLDEVEEATLAGQVWIAQRFVPQRSIDTPWGSRLVTLGVYVDVARDGEMTAAGYFARLSPTSHCSHDALVLPVFVDGTPEAS